MPRERARAACLHCGTPTIDADYCCPGCELVHGLLGARGLERYYDLAGTRVLPATAAASPHDHKWLEPLSARVVAAAGETRLDVDVQGVHCAACVWLLGELFERRPGAHDLVVNPGVGAATLRVGPEFDLDSWVREVESFGYVLGPHHAHGRTAVDALLLRLGVSAALALNTMIFALPLYLGLERGPVHTLFRTLSFTLSAATVAVGGTVFLRSAWQALRRRVLHLDQPIALGIVLAFGASLLGFARGHDGGAYFDTLAVFITLMLAGRWLQERVVTQNRRWLLASDGAEGLTTRRVRHGVVELGRCTDVEQSDALLIAPGDVVPVDAALEGGEPATLSLDWISGESAAQSFAPGATLPAGAFNAGQRALLVRAATAFAASPLVALLGARPRADDAARATAWWRRLAGTWVVGVLGLAVGGFAWWIVRTGDVSRALDVATAILVVTCPCAFGIATPLAYELVQAGLRRAGLFVRSPSFLDRAVRVRHVVFDKTGTLTSGVLRLADAQPLTDLAPGERDALYNLVARSTHPKSAAVRGALETMGARFVPNLDVVEHAGKGLELHDGPHVLRVGTPGFAGSGAASSGDDDVVFSADGVVLARLRTEEVLRTDAAAEVAALQRDGYAVDILSGDRPERVAEVATRVGLGAEHAVGAQSPAGKARWLDAHDQDDTLMIGDGINDALAVEHAFCSGTPAIDRPFMPARTDFYLVAAGLAPIRLALRASRALAATHRRNLCIATAYNVVTVGLALSGLMSPLLAAVLMPASSVGVVLATVAAHSGRSASWKSSSSRSS